MFLPPKMNQKIINVTVVKIAVNCIGVLTHRRGIRYENTPMQYAAIFKGCKNGNFQMKNCDSFLIFVRNIDCGYTLEPPNIDCGYTLEPPQ